MHGGIGPSLFFEKFQKFLKCGRDLRCKEPNEVVLLYRCEEEDYSVEDSLCVIQSKINEEKVNLFNVNRRRLLDGATRAITRKSFQEDGRISVKFSDDIGKSEGAIDAGGPTREFLRLAVAAAVNSSIFEGSDTNKCLAKCKTGSLNCLKFLSRWSLQPMPWQLNFAPPPQILSRPLYYVSDITIVSFFQG